MLELADIAIQKQADTIDALVRQGEQYRLAAEAAKPAVDYYERKDAWYHSKLLWFGLGFLGGAYAHRELAR